MSQAAKTDGSVSRWKTAEELTVALAVECIQFDKNGITVGLFSDDQKWFENVDGGVTLVEKIFTENGPNGGTDTAAALNHVVNAYLKAKKDNSSEAKPLIVFIVTDGQPNSQEDVERAIKHAVENIADDQEIRLNFVQIGDNEPAHQWLEKLDTGLNLKYDIVNCKTYKEMGSHASLHEACMAMITDEAEASA